jgi:hypothetical protein
MVNYFNNPWKPLRHRILKDKRIEDALHEKGYFKGPSIEQDTVISIKALFDSLHTMDASDGGMFYSVYSRDLEYRNQVHEALGTLLLPFLKDHFKDFKVMINSYVAKVSGPKSEFYLHQDTTGMDEWKESPLNLWIPLDDVDESNGCLNVIPESHKWFSPYRSISFPAPFDNIQPVVKEYLKPIKMKGGEVLFFDNRILHNSGNNTSGKTRIAVVCGLFPKDADLITCHKSQYELEGEVELIKHSDDFLLTYPKFLIDCQDRPHVGESLGFKEDPFQAIEEETFRELCHKSGLQSNERTTVEQIDCQLIGEPDFIQSELKSEKEPATSPPSFLNRIKSFFNG